MTDKEKETIGVVLLNLGGPDSLQAVRPFLYNLFSDRDIIRLGPAFVQVPAAWLISRLNSKKTEEMYRLIGAKSPILDITKAQADALEKALNGSVSTVEGSRFRVFIGMRYWHPYIKDAIRQISEYGIRQLIALSLYPHYSKATTGSTINEFKRQIKDRGLSVRYIDKWYDFPAYTDSLAELISQGVAEFKGNNFHILYSAHGLPESLIRSGDPYLDHIKSTVEKVNRRLSSAPYNIAGVQWHLSFQSKVGSVKWLQPSTEETIVKLALSGCKNLFVVPVSFVSDHIETLYEIDILYRAIARKYGVHLKRCEALNTSEKFIKALKELVMSKIKEGA